MKRFVLVTLLALGVFTTGCDFRYRISDSGASPEDVQQYVSDLVNLQGLDSGQKSKIETLYQDQFTYFYFNQWNAGKQSIKSIANLDFETVLGITPDKLKQLRIFYFHKIYDNQTSDDILVFHTVDTSDQSKVTYYETTNGNDIGYVESGLFTAILTGNNTSILVESYDVEDNDLATDIQLKLSTADENNYNLGRIVHLEGFPL